MKRLAIAALALVAVAAPAVTVTAWGNTGHRLIGVAAMRALPDDLPAFLRTPGAIADVGELAREPDRWKGGGQPHDDGAACRPRRRRPLHPASGC